MADNKQISYLTKDFASFKQQLIEFTKTYYPNSYSDFSPSSPGTIFIEMASYVGDTLSFYLDNQIQENFLQYAQQENNIFSLAYMMGYKPKVTSAATTKITLQQQVPSKLIGGEYVPDFNYALKIQENLQISSTTSNNQPFLISDSVDFSFSSSLDPTSVSTYLVSGGIPETFLLTKTRNALSATVKSTTFNFNNVEQFTTRNINADNIIGILDVIDSNGNTWYEVDYLAQDVVFDSIKNTNTNDPNFSSDNSDTPYLLKLKQADRRFVSRFISPNTLQLQFGSGVVANNDETIVPNPDNVGMGLPFEKDKLTTAFSPSNFIFTDSYGIAPSGELTVRYLVGGGTSTNVQSNTITNISNKNSKVSFLNNNLVELTAQNIFDSLQITNLEAASGGGDGDSLEEIKQNSIAQFQSQLRTVTQEDYLIRALSLPSQFGSIARVIAQSPLANSSSLTDENTAVVDLFCLSFDNNGKLKTPSIALKNNLKTYLSQYRMIGDSVNIKNAYIINIAVDFEIIVLPNYNSNEVIIKCINALQTYFNINNWQINQPIILRDLYKVLDAISGVQSVKNIKIINKAGTSSGYSAYGYDIEGATINGVIYPSIDPSIFEVKYLNSDIKGRVVSFEKKY